MASPNLSSAFLTDFNPFDFLLLLTIINPCRVAIPIIDPTILSSTFLIYNVYKPALIETLDIQKVASAVTSCDCP